MDSLQLVVSKFRSQIAALNIAKGANPSIYIQVNDAKLKGVFENETAIFSSLIKAGETKVLGKADSDPAGCVKTYINEDLTIFIKVVGLIDIKLEIDRVEKRITQLEDFKDKLNKKMTMKGYEQKVPETVRQENIAKLQGYETEISECKKSIDDLGKLN